MRRIKAIMIYIAATSLSCPFWYSCAFLSSLPASFMFAFDASASCMIVVTISSCSMIFCEKLFISSEISRIVFCVSCILSVSSTTLCIKDCACVCLLPIFSSSSKSSWKEPFVFVIVLLLSLLIESNCIFCSSSCCLFSSSSFCSSLILILKCLILTFQSRSRFLCWPIRYIRDFSLSISALSIPDLNISSSLLILSSLSISCNLSISSSYCLERAISVFSLCKESINCPASTLLIFLSISLIFSWMIFIVFLML
ncbi:unnamed protein product [Moneuplotes crassus]|uniref:Uncharacterized protein n=1 Tax=Euplotes crassus TaxID=5936 RepID=A0AAD2D0Y0_EUPCR|nr:unnamed protein product [Moneuplotes crassus]